MKLNYIILSALAISSILSSCKKDTTPAPVTPVTPSGPAYNVPTTYTFTNVSYSGQTTRLDMLAELTTYMKTGNTSGTVLSAVKMKEMYANINNQFTNTSLNTSGKQIKDKVFSLDQSMFELYMDTLAAVSTSTVVGSNGVAGVVTSPNDATKKYLCAANGIEYTQVIEKGLMGALAYYQTAAVYLDDSKIGVTVDNTTVVTGQGTAREHHWDEAFGYFGAPVDFPATSTISQARFWAKYCNARNTILSSNATIMNAFLKGRAAISNNDNTTKEEQRTIIRDNWEKVIAATIISYINNTKNNFADDAVRNHNLSEVIGFIMNLKYNPTKKITNAQITELEGYIGRNLYNVTTQNLDSAKDLLSTIYGLDSVKNSL